MDTPFTWCSQRAPYAEDWRLLSKERPDLKIGFSIMAILAVMPILAI
jgi:hypothetical protein